MSRIYFHSPSGDAEIRGAERAHAGCLVDKIGLGLLEPDRYDVRPLLLAALDKVPWSPREGRDDMALMLRGHCETAFVLEDGKKETPWRVSLNTAMRVGSRPMRLLARLHAQCEIHAWVDGPNREWLAGIIEEGRRDGLMRADMGWEGVVTLLRSRADEPVVTSYSVCEQFPNRGVADWEPAKVDEGGEPNYDVWYDMPDEERWSLAMTALRASTGMLELKPEGFDTFHFGAGVSALDLMERIRKPATAGR